jgi:hypothetical protein
MKFNAPASGGAAMAVDAALALSVAVAATKRRRDNFMLKISQNILGFNKLLMHCLP